MTRIAIIGSGIAGLFSALKLANSGHYITIITKQRVKDSSTNWAQGGIVGILTRPIVREKKHTLEIRYNQGWTMQ